MDRTREKLKATNKNKENCVQLNAPEFSLLDTRPIACSSNLLSWVKVLKLKIIPKYIAYT